MTTYFVLNGLWQGEEDYPAFIAGGHEPPVTQADGWYWIEDGMDDGVGPFKSRAAALRAQEACDETV